MPIVLAPERQQQAETFMTRLRIATPTERNEIVAQMMLHPDIYQYIVYKSQLILQQQQQQQTRLVGANTAVASPLKRSHADKTVRFTSYFDVCKLNIYVTVVCLVVHQTRR